MIKVTAIYPFEAGKTFDFDYYCNTHMPMVRTLLGEACKGIAVERGIALTPEQAPAFLAAGHLYFESFAAFEQAFAPHAAAIRADVPNYTDITYRVQISEVVA